MVTIQIVAIEKLFSFLYDYILIPFVILVWIVLFFFVEYWAVKIYYKVFIQFIKFISYGLHKVVLFVVGMFDEENMFASLMSFDIVRLKKAVKEYEKDQEIKTLINKQ